VPEIPSNLWVAPARPAWLQTILDETRCMDAAALVPLDAGNLIDTVVRSTGLSDFGDEDWREPFEVLTRSLEEESELHFFGRVMTRNELLNLLENRLRLEAAYKAHPEIDEQEVVAPLVITGLGRSGTSILFELLSQDLQFGAPSSWESMFYCPPPEAATYRSDPRIEKAHQLLTQWGRAAPPWQAMHEMGAWIPAESVAVFEASFRSDNMPSKAPTPSYTGWLAKADMTPAYTYFKRILKLLQWKNPRRHWLLKSPSHIAELPTLFKVFPDARVMITHRDPIKAKASITNMLATLYWMRSTKPFDVSAFEALMTPEATAFRLNQVVDWLESGAIPRDRVFSSRYVDLLQRPLDNMRQLYAAMEAQLSSAAEEAMQKYLAAKPQGKFGVHSYDVGEREQIQQERRLFARYQKYFDVPDEIV